MRTPVISVVIILIILLLWNFYARNKSSENYDDNLQYTTSGIIGVSGNLGSRALSPFLGFWIWKSDDELREQILTINVADEYFLEVQLRTNITYWYPPVNKNGDPWISRKETFVEKLPLCRVIVISDNEIVLFSINKTYIIPGPIHLRAYSGFIEYKGKKFHSSTVQRALDAKKQSESLNKPK